MIARLWRDRRAVTSIEYGIIGALVFCAAIGAIQVLSVNEIGLFTKLSNTVGAAISH